MKDFTKVREWAKKNTYDLTRVPELFKGSVDFMSVSDNFIYWSHLMELESILRDMDLFIYSVDRNNEDEGIDIWIM